MATEAEIVAARRANAERLRAQGVELFPARVPRDRTAIAEILARFGTADAAALERAAETVCVAGRIVALRSFGKMAFATVQADGERLQLWLRKDQLGPERWAQFQLYEVGDFAFARGPLVRTQKGELSVDVRELGFLAKTLRPLPEKWHGLVDVEARYRQRYLDLLANPEVRRGFVIRSRMISAMREWLDARGFLEVETPILQPIYGGAHARPFTTHHHTLDQELYLRISFELYLKRLVVGGIDRVYEIGRDFRNEGVSKKHNPEFTMLEVYQAYADYEDMMALVEQMVAFAAERALGTTSVEREGRKLELAPPWPRRSMVELIREASGVDISVATDLERAEGRGEAGAGPERRCRGGPHLGGAGGRGVLRNGRAVARRADLRRRLSRRPVAARQARPRTPADGRALRGLHRRDGDLQRLQRAERPGRPARALRGAGRGRGARGDLEAEPLDEDFLRALEHGMPPTGGMGLGIGRLAMIFTGASHLREVKLFPHLRSRDD